MSSVTQKSVKLTCNKSPFCFEIRSVNIQPINRSINQPINQSSINQPIVSGLVIPNGMLRVKLNSHTTLSLNVNPFLHTRYFPNFGKIISKSSAADLSYAGKSYDPFRFDKRSMFYGKVTETGCVFR